MINDLHFFSGTNNSKNISSGNNNINNNLEQRFDDREEENNGGKRTNFIRSARQNKLQNQYMQESEEIGDNNEAINYHEQKVDSIKQQLLDTQQLRQQQYQQKQHLQQQSQTAYLNTTSPKFIGRCKSETKTSKPAINNVQFSQENQNMTQLKSNLKSSNSYLNIFSSRQNQQSQQEQRLQISCITPEKLTERILDMPSPQQKREEKNISISPNKFGSESPIFQNQMLKQKGNSCERNSQSNLSIKEQSQRHQFIEQPAQACGLLTQDRKIESAVSECVEHKEPYSLFCDTDKKLCCVNCIYKGSGNHRNHNVIPLKQSFNLLKQELSNFKSKQKDKLHLIDEAIRIQSLNKQQILKTFFSYKEIVNKEFQKLIQAIQQRQSVVIEEINSAFSQKLMDAEENLKLLSEIRIEFKNFKETENQFKNGTFLQQVKVYSVKQQLNKSLKAFDSINIIENTKEEINQFDFQSKHSLMLEINQLGRIKNNPITKNQAPKQISQKSSSAYFSAIKRSISPNNAIKTTLRLDSNSSGSEQRGQQQIDGLDLSQRNLDLKLSLSAAGVRASLETPSGQNSITSRQRYPPLQQKSISPQSDNNQKTQPSPCQITQQTQAYNFNQKQNSITPPQMDYMNVFIADQFTNQNTVQTERQSCTSQASKKSFMFNDKPPLSFIKKQCLQSNVKSEDSDYNQTQTFSQNPIQIQSNQESEQKGKLSKGYNSSSHQGLFISNDGQFLNPQVAQNLSNKATPLGILSENSSQHQVLFQTQSGQYSTKRTQYSSNSQNGVAKFSSLSAQIKQITQNVPDSFENVGLDIIQIEGNDKENTFQEPEDQMVYLNQVSSRKEYTQPQQKMKQSNSHTNLAGNCQTRMQQSQEKKMTSTHQQKKDLIGQVEKLCMYQQIENNVKENSLLLNNQKQSQVFEGKANILSSQIQQNPALNNTSQNSFILNTSQLSNNQGEYNKSSTSIYSVSNKNNNNNNINLNSGNNTTRRINGNKLFYNESLENSNEANKELIKQLNEEILYENFAQDQEERNLTMSAQLIESMNLKEREERDQFTHQHTEILQNAQKNQSYQIISSPNPNPIYFIESKILDNESREQLISILPFKVKSTSQLYSMKEDKLSSDIFHEKCDGRGPYIILVKANSFVFGYYSPISFVKCDKYITCSNSFIFSLNNIYKTPPSIFPVKQDKKFIALYQSIKNPCLGSTLQNKQDLWIKYVFSQQILFLPQQNSFDDPRNSFSCLGYAYKLEGQYDGNKILAGQYTDWNVQGIEVFNVVQ